MSLNEQSSNMADITDSDPPLAPTAPLAINITNLRVDFGQSVPVLDRLDFTVREGEFVAIVGGSGCGKTTLMNVVAGLIPASQGHVEVNSGPPHSGNSDIAYILARDSLLPWRTVRRNVEYALRLSGVDKESRRQVAEEYLDRVGLNLHLDKYPSTLSQGQRQRVSLARAFSVGRSIYLLDEPFSALDAQTKVVLQDQLLDLWERDRKTVVFVTHDIGEAVTLADRVVVMAPKQGIIDEVLIDFERPRSAIDLQDNDEYHDVYRRVAHSLKGGML